MSVKRRKAAAFLVLLLEDESQPPKKRLWARNWLLRRKEQGCFGNLLKELSEEDNPSYRSWLRMDGTSFHYLAHFISPLIRKESTLMRESISPEERLAVTLRYLATGETFLSLSFNFRISRQCISSIVLETCKALSNVLQKEYVHVPKTVKEWKGIANQFKDMWNFPMCLGAVDGKHIVIQPPASSGSYYFNYKGTHSIVLMAVVDADLMFRYIDIGTNGRISDGGVWNKCSLSTAITQKKLNLPQAEPLPSRQTVIPYVFVADDAFSLKPYLMKPYSGSNLDDPTRIFNYRLSRARRCVENAFGILANRWRVFRAPINLAPEKVQQVVLASCCLHNFLRSRSATRHIYSPAEIIDHEDVQNGTVVPGSWRGDLPSQSMLPVNLGGSNNYSAGAKDVRKEFENYFVSDDGAVSWQGNVLYKA